MFYKLEKKGPLKKLDSSYGFRQEFVMSCNCHVTNKPYIVIKYTEDGIKNCIEFPISEIEYDGMEYTAYFNSFNVKKHMMTVLDILKSFNTNYKMYLLYNDMHNNPKYAPVNIVREEANYVVLQEGYDFVADVLSMIFEEATKGTSIWYDDKTFKMPRISQIWYNKPYTTMKWSDGSVTTAKCSENETFSKEVGVAMCISKKYLECRGFEYARTGFKSIVEKGVDLKEIHDKRDRKKALKRAIDMAKAGYSMDEIKNTLNLTDDDVLDLFKDESTKE